MTYFPEFKVELSDTAQLDSFGRLRVSISDVLFEAKTYYDKQPLFWTESLTGGATSTFIANKSKVQLSLPTTSGAKAVRQTKEYHSYRPGKSHLILMTGVIGVAKSNVRQRWGYFDNNNGLFFEQTISGLSVVRRTFTSGSVVDNSVTRSSWNIDKLDGTGVSGINLDLSKTNIFVINFQWLGVGRAVLGIDFDGKIYPCHQFLNANIQTEVYMQTGSLPVRYEIENTGTSASSTALDCICCTVSSEGGNVIRGQSFTKGTIVSKSLQNGVRTPIIAIRLKSAFNRASIIPKTIDLITGINPVYWELVLNPTLTSPSWVSVDPDSYVEYDISGTGGTGGTVIAAGNVSSSIRGMSDAIETNLRVVSDYAGTSDILLLAGRGLTGNSASYGTLNWLEIT